jgi:hypothetical protein
MQWKSLSVIIVLFLTIFSVHAWTFSTNFSQDDSSNWTMVGEKVWDFTNGYLNHRMNGTVAGQYNGYMLTNPAYKFSWQDEWNVTYLIDCETNSLADCGYTEHGFILQNTTASVRPASRFDVAWYNALSNAYFTALLEYPPSYSGTQSWTGGVGNTVNNDWINLTFKKFNMYDSWHETNGKPNGFYIEYYRNGVLTNNYTHKLGYRLHYPIQNEKELYFTFWNRNVDATYDRKGRYDNLLISVKEVNLSFDVDEHTQDSDGIKVFNNFDTDYLSHYYHTTQNGVWSFLNTSDGFSYLTFYANASGLPQATGYMLNGTNFTVSPLDLWNLTFKGRINDQYYHNSFVFDSDPTNLAVFQSTNHSYYAVGVHLDSVSDNYSNGYFEFEEYNGTGINRFQTTSVYPLGDNMRTNWAKVTFRKTNNPNGTINIECLAADVSLANITSFFNYSKEMPSTVKYIGLRPIGINQWDFYSFQSTRLEAPSEPETPSNTAPTVNILSPPNESHTNVQMPVIFNVTDTENASVSCSLYIDSGLNATNASVVNDTTSYFYHVWVNGIHTWYVTCSDAEFQDTSDTYSFNFDNSTLFIQSATPSSFNTTIFSGYTMDITGNVTNSDIGIVNRTIYYPNSTVFFHNSSGALPINTSLYQWDDSFNTTLMPNGIYNMFIYTVDNGDIHNTSAYLSFQIQNCIPDWTCTGFNACNISDRRVCTAATDLNACGLPYEGDYTEFGEFVCNYCDADIFLLNQSDCANDSILSCYDDLNFAFCCNVTGLGSDCYGGVQQTEEVVCVEEACESGGMFAYSENDITGAVIGTLGKGLVTVSILAGLITIGMLGLWGYNRLKMM